MEVLVINNYKTIIDWKYNKFNRKDKRGLEQVAKKINKTINLRKSFVFLVGSLLYCETVLAKNVDLSKVDKGGYMVLGLIQGLGFWVAIIMAGTEIIKNLMQGDTKDTFKIMFKYWVGYASLYLILWGCELIKSMFA